MTYLHFSWRIYSAYTQQLTAKYTKVNDANTKASSQNIVESRRPPKPH